jgi:superfamily I DNA/RNA helicase
MFIPSARQQAIFNAVKNGFETKTSTRLLVNAVAGSGKTTTILRALAQLPNTSTKLFLAFNTSAVKDAQARAETLGIKNLVIKTLNSAGHHLVMNHLKSRRITLDNYKVSNALEELRKSDLDSKKVIREYDRAAAAQLVDLAKAHGIIVNGGDRSLTQDTYDNWAGLVQRFGVEDAHMNEIQAARRVLSFSSRNRYVIDFNDQCYLPFYYDAKDESYDVVAVDEAQDLTIVQQNLAGRFVKPNGVMIFVGDRAQAIYGFRGADTNSMDNILNGFNCTEYPLDVSYRCPRAVVEAAQVYNPVIQSHPDAEQGLVTSFLEYSADNFSEGDMVVCRNRAPLVRLALKLLMDRMPVKISADIVSSIMKVLTSISKKTSDLQEGLMAWRDERLNEVESEAAKAGINDMYDCCKELVVAYGNVKRIKNKLEELDGKKMDASECVTLLTIHRAKGLEADTVWLLDGHLMPSAWAREEWEKQQEMNLAYVATTRAQKRLINITAENYGETRLRRYARVNAEDTND